MNGRRGGGAEVLVAGAVVLVATGCGGKTSSLLLERQARGPIEEEQAVAKPIAWVLEPITQTKTQSGVEVTVTHANIAYLNQLFTNKQIFGGYAGLNPYFREQMVLYVKIANTSGKKLRFDPREFTLLDEKGNQYQSLGPDYATALAESKAPMATMTRGVLEDARPGYFGVGVPVGKIIGKPQQRFALLNMASLQAGYLYDGVVYDGLVAFWSPHRESQKLTFLLANIKTDFDPADFPQAVLDIAFEFTASHPQ